MLLFPFFENIEDRRFLIIGGGRIAKQKLSVLLRFTDRITLVAEDFAPEVEGLKGRKKTPDLSCCGSALHRRIWILAIILSQQPRTGN